MLRFDEGVVSPFCIAEASGTPSSLLLSVRLVQQAMVSKNLRPKSPRTGGSVGRQAQMTPTLTSTMDQNNTVAVDPEDFLFC